MTYLKRSKPRRSETVRDLKPETIKYSINLPRDLHKQFKKKSFMNEVDMKDIIIEAIRKYVST